MLPSTGGEGEAGGAQAFPCFSGRALQRWWLWIYRGLGGAGGSLGPGHLSSSRSMVWA